MGYLFTFGGGVAVGAVAVWLTYRWRLNEQLIADYQALKDRAERAEAKLRSMGKW